MLGAEIIKGAGIYPLVSTGHVSVTNSCPWVRSPSIGAIIQAELLGWVWGQIWEGGRWLSAEHLLGAFPETMLEPVSILFFHHSLAASGAAARQVLLHSPTGSMVGSM